MSLVTLVLFLLALGIVAYEFYAIGNPQRGDTISENVWRIRATWLGASIIGGLFFWLAFHFVLYGGGGIGWRDALAVAVGVIAARWAGPHRSTREQSSEQS